MKMRPLRRSRKGASVIWALIGELFDTSVEVEWASERASPRAGARRTVTVPTQAAYIDPASVLDEVVTAAVALIPGTDEGPISVVTGRRYLTSQAPSGDLPQRIDALQVEVGEGPCLTRCFSSRPCGVPDMANEQRWPKSACRAAETGARSMFGQAKGILMERYKIDADQAFRVLARVSQQHNRKLRD